MSEGMEKLRSIGARKIHEQTHIAHRYVQSILHESFEGMQKIQLSGFISILEREYHVELDDLRKSVEEYFRIQEASIQKEEPSYKKELLVSSKKTNPWPYIAAVALVGLLAASYAFFYESKTDKPKPQKSIDTSQRTITPSQEAASSTIDRTRSENPTTVETVEKSQTVQKPQGVRKTFRIVPKSKVWIGIVDLKKGKKIQKTITQPLELNASRDYLLTLGHGYVDIATGDSLQTFREPQSLKFIYENGELRKISLEEFKRYNKGKLW